MKPKTEATTAPAEADAPAPKRTDWHPPKVDQKTGHELVGGYPVAGPARAEALAKAGVAEDPNGLVSPEAIAAYASTGDDA